MSFGLRGLINGNAKVGLPGLFNVYNALTAAAAACENGLCDKGSDIRVILLGGELTVNVSDERVLLTGGASVVYEGCFQY